MKKIMDGNEACSHIAYHFTEVAGIYPITPASPMAELTDQWASMGKKNMFGHPVKSVEMESEAGAAGMIHGSLQAGCLTTTYTASQGLLLMIPNLYKMAGELLPCVIHVASRSIATHALSIFGDHQDVYAVRSTGIAMLSTSSVQEVMDLTAVAHLAAIKGRVPFLHFFDGFRTSHELQKIEVLDVEKLDELVDKDALSSFRNQALSRGNIVTRGTTQNDDIYFQNTEVRNPYYEKLPTIVEEYMQKINQLTGRHYAPFNYYGDPQATNVIVAMGSVSETIKETVDYLVEQGEKVGFVQVHLYRPFSYRHLLKAIPKTVEKIAVLDRTKEAGSLGEPLYLDVASAIQSIQKPIAVYGGRYGLSSKNTTPAMIKGVYDFLAKQPHHNFTVGIEDDVTHLSISYDTNFHLPSHDVGFLVYGYGSDGMVSASKDMMKITGMGTDAYVQGYFQYDSKKSGGITISHLRFSKEPIRSSYYVERAKIVMCTKDVYLKRLEMFESLEENGLFILNSSKSEEEILSMISTKDQKMIQDRSIRLLVINASEIAKKNGLPGKISAIMESILFTYGHIIDKNYAISKLKESLESRFAKKSGDLAKKNMKAIEEALGQVKEMICRKVSSEEKEKEKDFFEIIDTREGDHLPTSCFVKYADGTLEGGLSRFEKRDIADLVPCYHKENCISCNLCSLVCPHAVIRPFLLNKEEEEKAPKSVVENLIPSKIKDQNLKFTIGVSLKDCTGCTLCASVCPGKKNQKALTMIPRSEATTLGLEESANYLFKEVTPKEVLPINTVKGSQFRPPRFEFPGACAGCGETAYLKLLTQLFGSRLVIANATGCSSIYGASFPSTPYTVPWANSLFEDNAEFGFGMHIADTYRKEAIQSLIAENVKKVSKKELPIYQAYLKEITEETASALEKVIDHTPIEGLKEYKSFLLPQSIWMIGGDGWAYDIGYNGIDHVLASGENVNILVLDTEVYSNTGGQASKSSPVGSVSKFASSGKKTAKKDLAKIALTYPNVYVACVSLGANPQAVIKALEEAENYQGPSLVIAYAPCIAQGILKGMTHSLQEEKEAATCGYFPIFRYHPETKKMILDSQVDFSHYEDFLAGEDRYQMLNKVDKKNQATLLQENLKNAKERYAFYESLVSKKDS